MAASCCRCPARGATILRSSAWLLLVQLSHGPNTIGIAYGKRSDRGGASLISLDADRRRVRDRLVLDSARRGASRDSGSAGVFLSTRVTERKEMMMGEVVEAVREARRVETTAPRSSDGAARGAAAGAARLMRKRFDEEECEYRRSLRAPGDVSP
jgi:hypothetical protein